MTARLSPATLDRLPPDVRRPGYDRSTVTPGVVHLGLGAFHRAHQAVVFERCLQGGDHRWGVIGASLRSSAVCEQLEPQDGFYSVVVRETGAETVQVVGAIRRVLAARQATEALIEALASPQTHLVTLTITEKGYGLGASGGLNTEDPDVQADLQGAFPPRTAAGFIVEGLARRRTAGLAPFTAISCDNLPRNGLRLREAVVALAAPRRDGLAGWIEREGAFPETMVDRIVPAATEADIAALAGRLGVEDRAMVKTEPFLQWVIEDRFAGPRPAFEAAGVQVVDSVAVWETAKLRLLNGAHSAMAYLGGLAGLEFVHEFAADPPLALFVEGLWDEAEATLPADPTVHTDAYCASLMARFRNPALKHRLEQIAMDGSQKLPPRLLSSIAARLERGWAFPHLALAVAAWMRWQTGKDELGRPFTVDDPLAARTQAEASKAQGSDDLAGRLLAIREIFPQALAENPVFRTEVSLQLDALCRLGALQAARRLVSGA